MRLLTHNMLSCNIKGITNGFPLRLEVEKFVEKEVDFNPDFLKNMFVKIEWKALVNSARSMNYVELPEEADSSLLESEDFLKKFHHALLELHLEEGALICPETGRRFPVSKGIPNMLLHEDEISSQKKKAGGIAPKHFVQRVKKQNELFRSLFNRSLKLQKVLQKPHNLLIEKTPNGSRSALANGVH